MWRRIGANSLAVMVVMLAGCASGPQPIRRAEYGRCYRGVLFSLDGAGGFGASSDAVQMAIDAEGVPLWVEVVPWSHGYGRVLSDQLGHCHSLEEGRRLAVRITAYRQQNLEAEIDLIGHSAGAAVALAAASALPPDTVNRIILLSPDVSTHYDLRPALRSARQGIDVYYSQRDKGYLGVWTGIVGTADGYRDAAAGRVGFRIGPSEPCDAALYARLRQHPWNPTVAWTGNLGGHYGSHHERFLRAYIVPLLMSSSTAVAR